jgi:DNA-3-methyladenine glycosylase I
MMEGMGVETVRCSWVAGSTDPLMIAYHDTEWGVPSHDENHLYEMLCLEGAQAGLSWSTILRKREGYRELFQGFDPEAVARFDEWKVNRLMENPAIVRNRMKIESVIGNAKATLSIQHEFGSLDLFLWKTVGGAPVDNRFTSMNEIPVETDVSRELSTSLKRHGFRFVGSTVCYAFMQATGMVNDHTIDCFRHSEINNG